MQPDTDIVSRSLDSPYAYYMYWPTWLLEAPTNFYLLFMSLFYGGPGVFSVVNPDFPDGKTDILDLVLPEHREFVPAFCGFQGTSPADALAVLEGAGLDFPVVAKPDVGLKGIGVEVLSSEEALARYLAQSDPTKPIHFQRYIDMPGEAGVFYVRQPDEERGRLISLTQKCAPCVIGDGVSTAEQLVLACRRPLSVRQIYLKKLGEDRLGYVPAKGERYILHFARNGSQGGLHVDLTARITPEITEVFDGISQGIRGFYLGRYDVGFTSIDELLAGKSFKIFEINDVTSGDLRFYSDNGQLLRGYLDIFRLMRALLRIGATNKARGHRPESVWAIARKLSSTKDMVRKFRAKRDAQAGEQRQAEREAS